MMIDAIDPGNFIEPRLYVTDPTIERLAALLAARPRGMMLIRDELAGFFANMSRYSPGSDRPFWLEAWDGGRHIVERVRGSTVVEHLLVGVIGSFQPDKLARAFAGDEDRDVQPISVRVASGAGISAADERDIRGRAGAPERAGRFK